MQTTDIPDEEIIAACRAWHDDPSLPTPDIALAGKYPAKVILSKMEKLVKRGVLECGVSLRTAWVVEGQP